MAWVATAIVGSAVIGGISTSYAASKAADAQTAAGERAIGMQQQQYQQTRQDLDPYRAAGADATTQLRSRIGELTTPVSVNPDDFKNSDMYKFAQTQGERAVTNSSAARGLATSGAALKGAAAFESGLNLQNWQQNFNNQVTNQTNAYTRLKGLVDTGENAAAQTGALGEKAAYNSGTAAVGEGNAQAAADNKIGSSIANTANGIGGYMAYKGLYGGGTVANGGITLGNSGGPTAFS